MRRLRKLLFWINLASHYSPANSGSRLAREITFGRYTGDTPVTDFDQDREKPKDHLQELGELVTRADMRSSPPDILVTNFTMLEYSLLRSDDQDLFNNSASFKMLILDEVHTYSGTLGTEVAMLLRRLKTHLSQRAGESVVPIFVGTSATVGSGAIAKNAMAKFASQLSGSEFTEDQVIIGKPSIASGDKSKTADVKLREMAARISEFVARRPLLLKLIAHQISVNEAPAGWPSTIVNDLEELTLLVDGHWDEIDADMRSPEALCTDPEGRCREILGKVVQKSSPLRCLIDLIQRSDGACLTLQELQKQYFDPESSSGAGAIAAQTSLSCLLTIIASATANGRAVFPVRFHHFVTEKREGLLCLNPRCPGPLPASDRATDGW
jgi:hypothetical protein